MFVYRVEFYCPRSGKMYWQRLKGGFLGMFDQTFPDRASAENACNSLLMLYHSARVIDPWGNEVYRI